MIEDEKMNSRFPKSLTFLAALGCWQCQVGCRIVAAVTDIAETV
jgi:hypothetical protein